MDNLDRETNPETTLERLSDEFLELINFKNLESILKERVYKYANKYNQEWLLENINNAVEKEKTFIKKVINAYMNWSKENDPVVLWDIDDTIGRLQGERWGYRPSMPSILQFLKEKFPNIENGILSDRDHVAEQISDGKLNQLQGLINFDHIHSTRSLDWTETTDEQDREQRKAFKEAKKTGVMEELEYLSIGGYMKLKIVKDLKKQGVNAKSIDDYDLGKTLGGDAINVWAEMPKDEYCE
ncbi:MAG: hypothetical protein Q8P30_04720 [Candidatus Uhrbacteria bacterium]|nr:hypothetical protein [Candidatus Uhrbacteria bacterium]